MRAVTIVDGSIQIREHADPVAGFGQILVKVHAAGLNGADMHQLVGKNPIPADAPKDIPGLELAGEVVACGPGATRFKPGARVMAITSGGAQAEFALLHERAAMPVPEGLSWHEAGALPEVFTTAHDALFTQGKLAPGERLLVHGAAGGVGIAAVQLGIAIGARVTAVVRSPDIRGRVAAFGANAIDPGEIVAHGPYDFILELVGPSNFATNLATLAKAGRIALIGIAGGGGSTEFDLRALMKTSGTIFGSSLRGRPLEQKADTARRMEAHVLPLFDSGRLKIPVHAIFPLAEAATAYDAYQVPGKLGKIVLSMTGDE